MALLNVGKLDKTLLIFSDVFHTKCVFYLMSFSALSSVVFAYRLQKDLPIHAIIQTAIHVLGAQCMKSCGYRSRAGVAQINGYKKILDKYSVF